MAACSSYLRRPRQASSLVSSYFKTTTTTSRTSITRDLITQPPSLSRFLSSSSSIKASSLPWLMLTPEIELSSGTDTVFKFYSLAEGKVISVERKNLKAQLGLESKRSVSLECRGSSHGWLVLYEGCGGSDLFLYNPLSNRHLKLPTIRRKDPPAETNSQYHCVNKVIISSPDPEGDASCRAVMIHGDKDKLAFCCPKNGEWVETHHRSDDVACFAGDGGGGGGVPLFLGVDDSVWPYPEFEGWDLKDVSRPMLISLEDRLAKDFKRTFPWKGFGSKKKPWMSRHANFLVAAAGGGGGGGGGVYYVCLEGGDLDEEWDYRFHVHKFDFEKGKVVHMDRSLDGLALFVGRNHSFALSAAEFPEVLEPDSIYFTNPEDCCLSVDEEPFGKKHMRVYDYKDGTFSKTPFYTVTKSDDKDATYGPPMWYTPTCAAAAADELVS